MELSNNANIAGEPPKKKPRKSNDNLMARLWLSKNFEVVKDSQTTFAEIMSRYQSEKDNVNFELSRSDVTALVSQLFVGEVRALYPRGHDGRRPLAFRNLGLKSNSASRSQAKVPPLHGWIERGRTETETNFVRFTGYKVNGHDHSLLLTVKSDLSFCITGTSGTPASIDQDAFGLTPDNSNTSVDLPTILQCLSGILHPCLGFNKTGHHSKVLRRPDEEQFVIEIDVNGDARLISKACEVITKKKDGFCKSCNLAKKRLGRRKTEFKNIKFTKNSVLSKQELCLKLDMVTREKRNAVRREEYCKT
ncbi:hypothetical protein ACROYT_G031707 [Oculina patagonica]